MLHGYLSSKETFIHQINFIKRYRKVYAIDLDGFGESPPLNKAFSLDDYVYKVKDFITKQGIKSYDLLAHSFGGRIAIKLAKIDNRLDKIVLTGCAGLKPRRKIGYYFKVYTYKILKRFIPPEKLKNFGSIEYRSLSSIHKKSYLKIVNEHLDNELKYINNKTLLIFGERDCDTPIYMAKKLNKNIKNSSLIIIKGAGHFAFIDKPFEFNLYLREFLLGE